MGNKTVLLTGGNGFLGRHLQRELKSKGYKVFAPTRKEADFLDYNTCILNLGEVNSCIHLAAEVGGMEFNMNYPARVYYNNVTLGMNILNAARISGTEKVVIIGTASSYPEHTKIPIMEEYFWFGEPEPLTASYGNSKRALLAYSNACRKQYGLNSIHLIPTNVYGEGDDFNSEHIRVVAATIKKVYEAKKNNLDFIKVWGTGKTTREFLHVKDCVRGIVLALEKYDDPKPINLGTGKETSIMELVKTICKLMDYNGEIIFDPDAPDSHKRRILDVKKARDSFGFYHEISLYEGLKRTIEWYIGEVNNVQTN